MLFFIIYSTHSSPSIKNLKNFTKLNTCHYFIYNNEMKFRYDKDTEEIVVSDATRIEYHQVGLWLTRHVKGYRYMPAFKMGVWNGQQTYFKNGRVNLGLWKEAMRGCKEIDVPFVLENKEDFPLNRDVTLEKVKDFCKEFFKKKTPFYSLLGACLSASRRVSLGNWLFSTNSATNRGKCLYKFRNAQPIAFCTKNSLLSANSRQ
jgi:hypothetical protein